MHIFRLHVSYLNAALIQTQRQFCSESNVFVHSMNVNFQLLRIAGRCIDRT